MDIICSSHKVAHVAMIKIIRNKFISNLIPSYKTIVHRLVCTLCPKHTHTQSLQLAYIHGSKCTQSARYYDTTKPLNESLQ